MPANCQARALDLGTGSGCPGHRPGRHAARARVDATDLSGEALTTARQNAARHQVAERIEFHQGDGFAALGRERSFDLIVSNPPYVATADIQTLEPEVRDYRAGAGRGASRLNFTRRIARAGAFLTPGGGPCWN